MAGWLDRKYIELLSSQLHRFKDKGNGLYNFACPLCNEFFESKKRGARGYLYERDGNQIYTCHRCGRSAGFSNFLKEIDPVLGREYTLEWLRESGNFRERTQKAPEKPKEARPRPSLKQVAKLSHLPSEHPARSYMASRGFSDAQLRGLLYVATFKKWVNSLLPGKFDPMSLTQDEPRIIIPFLNTEREMTAFQGRSLRPDSKVKYITIVLDEDVPAIYGLDRIDWSRDVFVHEGPLDAMILGNNSIATAGGDLASKLKGLEKDKLIIVYDNEPRSKTTVAKIKHAIDAGFRVGLWSSELRQKDVNDMILAGFSPADLIQKINVYTDLAARLALSDWSKIDNDSGRASRPYGDR